MKTTQQLIELQRSITQGEWNSHCPVPALNTIAAVNSVHGMHVCDVSSYGAAIETRNSNAAAIALVPELLAEVIRLRGALASLVNGEITLSNKSSALYSKGDYKGYLSEHCPKVITARALLADAN